MKFEVKLFATDKEITLGRQILITQLEALGDIQVLDFTTSGRTDLLQIMENREYKNNEEVYWGGGKHISNEFIRTYTILSKPIKILQSDTQKYSSEYLFCDKFFEKKFKFIHICDYLIRPEEIYASTAFAQRINVKSVEFLREKSTIQYKIVVETIK